MVHGLSGWGRSTQMKVLPKNFQVEFINRYIYLFPMRSFFIILVLSLWLLEGVRLSAGRIYIIHTNSSNGNIENCHCPGHPYGTLEKRAAFIDSVLNMGKNPIVVETGDFLSPLGNRLKDKYVIKCLEFIPYDAVLPGDQEFANGISFFKKYVLKSKLPLTCYNLSISGVSIPSYRIVEREGYKIALTGIIDPETIRFYDDSIRTRLNIEPPKSAIPRLYAELSGKADFVILLSHSGYEQDLMLANSFPNIPVIIGGHSQTLLKKAEKHNRTLLVQAGRAGYYLGILMLNLSKDANIQSYASDIITLTEQMPDHSGIMKLAREYKEEWRQKHFK